MALASAITAARERRRFLRGDGVRAACTTTAWARCGALSCDPVPRVLLGPSSSAGVAADVEEHACRLEEGGAVRARVHEEGSSYESSSIGGRGGLVVSCAKLRSPPTRLSSAMRGRRGSR
eukprot:scaffold7432_cov107-Isochrysis_galbana.AAC.10